MAKSSKKPFSFIALILSEGTERSGVSYDIEVGTISTGRLDFSMRVAIIGTGYVGLTTGVCLAFIGHKVSCLDTDETKIANLKAGKIPIYEPNLTELLEEARPNLHFTSNYAEAIPDAEVVFIAVGTPPTP